MMRRPVIAVTTSRFFFAPIYLLVYLAVWTAGGRVKHVPPGSSFDSSVDGLILAGGTHVSPALFKAQSVPEYSYDHSRDATELAWLEKARQAGMPVLGICRGAQIMAVSHKGTLHLEVNTAYKDAEYPSHPASVLFYRKPVRLKASSLIRRITRKHRLYVNSLHRQSIRKTGDPLVVTGVEDNGVVQAIEDPNRPFYLGVQFHPELLIYRRRFRHIFRALVETAARYREKQHTLWSSPEDRHTHHEDPEA
jgi:putative glutamine amidotransferase